MATVRSVGALRFLWANLLLWRVREEGAIRKPYVLIASAVHACGCRENLGMEIAGEESGASWLPFFRGLVVRGLSGASLLAFAASPGCSGARRARTT